MDKEPIYYDCTLAKFAEQLNVPLWKAMCFGKYFDTYYKSKVPKKIMDGMEGAICDWNKPKTLAVYDTEGMLWRIKLHIEKKLADFQKEE